MGKKWRILFAIALLSVISGAVWVVLPPREPVYKGKPLSAWLRAYGRHWIPAAGEEEAVKRIGTNAIPTLLRMLRAKDSALKAKLIQLIPEQGLLTFKLTRAADLNLEGAEGFGILGAKASNAVPALVRIYEESISTESQCLTATAIGEIGPAASNAIPSLLIGLATTNAPVRWNTVWALGQIHEEPVSVLPVLSNLLHDPNSHVRTIAAQALGNYSTIAK